MRIADLFDEHIAVIKTAKLQCNTVLEQFAAVCCEAIRKGNRVFFMGNGGSAADSQHLAAEFVGRFQTERQALPAIALTTDTSVLTAIGNDYGFGDVFSRQVEALANAGDVVVGISTSGNSPNVVKAIETAKRKGCITVGMTGINGGHLATHCNICLAVPSTVTARVQETHILMGHIVCQAIDEMITQEGKANV